MPRGITRACLVLLLCAGLAGCGGGATRCGAAHSNSKSVVGVVVELCVWALVLALD
jgi:hypothetical protein